MPSGQPDRSNSVKDLRPFLPAKNFELSKRLYERRQLERGPCAQGHGIGGSGPMLFRSMQRRAARYVEAAARDMGGILRQEERHRAPFAVTSGCAS